MGGCTSKDKTVAEAEGCVIFSFHFLSISVSPFFSLSLYNVAPADDDNDDDDVDDDVLMRAAVRECVRNECQ